MSPGSFVVSADHRTGERVDDDERVSAGQFEKFLYLVLLQEVHRAGDNGQLVVRHRDVPVFPCGDSLVDAVRTFGGDDECPAASGAAPEPECACGNAASPTQRHEGFEAAWWT